MTPRAQLTAARALISHPAHWIKKTSGTKANGKPDNSDNLSEAVCFCALGALWRAGDDCRSSQAEAVLNMIVRTTTRFDNPVSFNDDPSTTHADVLRVFDLAVAAAAGGEV
jgi:hypothetical protein